MVKKLSIIAIIQARVTSKRFPEKVLQKVGKFTLIELINKRLKTSKHLDSIVYSIPKNKKNKKLELHLLKNKFTFYKGSEQNVVERYFKTAQKFKAHITVRITSD